MAPHPPTPSPSALPTANLPAANLPAEICAADDGSFAGYTLRQRLPHIIEQIIADNAYSAEVIADLEALTNDIFQGVIQPLNQTDDADAALWHRCLQPYVGQTWFAAPFFLVEMYFYRRINEIIGGLNASGTNKQQFDPFRLKKRNSFAEAIAPTLNLVEWLHSIEPTPTPSSSTTDQLRQILLANLWSNCADLSQLPQQKTDAALGQADKLLLDDSEALITDLIERDQPLDQVDIILDNTGIELISDLALADFLIQTQLARRVRLHTKAQPVFVSDAMNHDVFFTITSLIESEISSLKQWGVRLNNLLENQIIEVLDHPYWTLPIDFKAIATAPDNPLANSDLWISKGDANYRRLLGDRHWDINTPVSQIVDYLPCDCLALRVLKSEILVGVSSDRLQQFPLDDHWMTNGTYGIIQYVPVPISDQATPVTVGQ